eukprot:Gb_35282 [translate_table: standard]
MAIKGSSFHYALIVDPGHGKAMQELLWNQTRKQHVARPAVEPLLSSGAHTEFPIPTKDCAWVQAMLAYDEVRGGSELWGGTVDSMEFKFDDVLLSAANQADVYNRAAQAIDVLDGYNGTILAYGQTGAGKTYTLSAMVIDKYGVQTAEGMVPRSAADIFARVAEDKDHEYHVSMSYIQIYMEIIQDLLRPENLNLQIREGEDGNIFVAGVEEASFCSLVNIKNRIDL